MIDDIKATLELALSSPDAAVRSAAIRYRELEGELNGYESFFTFYGKAQSEPLVVTSAGKPREKAEGSLSTVEFLDRVRVLLLEHRRPMKIGHLYDVYFERYTDQPKTQADTFRQRLFKRRDVINLIQGEGYWPSDVPLLGAVNTEEPVVA